jgi:hypothetical protein
VRLQMETKTSLSPTQVVAALTDFSKSRPQMWTGITPEHYQVYSVGESSADVREGTKRGGMNVWAREAYDWSTPNTVTWTVQESNFCTPGSYVHAEISPLEGGGSLIRSPCVPTSTSMSGRFVFAIMKLSRGKVIETSMRKGLENYEHELNG